MNLVDNSLVIIEEFVLETKAGYGDPGSAGIFLPPEFEDELN